jgi:hypothetical protein
MQLFLALTFITVQNPEALNNKISLEISAPPIECNIRLQKWCIADFNSKIQMRQYENIREWEIFDNSNLKSDPIKIYENLKCSFSNATHVRKSYKEKIKNDKNEKIVIKYYLTNLDDCPLEFEVPTSDGVVPDFYVEKMKSVLICDLGKCAGSLPDINIEFSSAHVWRRGSEIQSDKSALTRRP